MGEYLNWGDADTFKTTEIDRLKATSAAGIANPQF